MQLSKLSIVFCLLFAFGGSLSAQDRRYLEPVFSNVSKTTALYGSNFTILLGIFVGHTVRQPLVMDVYTPDGDTETERPLIIFLHTGNFFPFPLNGACSGALNDSANVAFATRLAKMGYVVAVAEYRQGWAPTHPDELVRRFSLINAVYRGMQDVRSCIRYFRKTADVDGNPWGIDPDKVVVWGLGTGGYLSLATAYLDKFSEIYTTADPNKFTLQVAPGVFVPDIVEFYNGDIEGVQTAPGIVDSAYNQITNFPIGDTIYVQNTPGYSSEFQLAVNMGGALADSSWMEAGDIPLISYHVPSDNFAPCGTGILLVGIGMPVLETSGSCDMQQIANDLGLNDIFNTILDPHWNDPYAANSGSPLNGFYPFTGTPIAPGSLTESSGPWSWTSYSGDPVPNATGCAVDGNIARTYIDTIIGYYAPRACVALGLDCAFMVDNTKELNGIALGLQVSPVPAYDAVTFQTKEVPMRNIYVYDLNGRLVKAYKGVNSNVFQMQRNSLPNGMYIAELRFDDGFVKRKIVFNN